MEQADQENAEPERHDVARGPQSKIADAPDEHVADDDVEKAPEHVHGRRGDAFPRRLRKRALERSSHRAADEMGNGVRQKGAPKKVRYEGKPLHCQSLLFPSRSMISRVVPVSPSRGKTCAML